MLLRVELGILRYTRRVEYRYGGVAYEKTTPSGKESPGLRGAIAE